MKRTFLTTGLVALLAACSTAEAGPEWLGSATDSAGVRMINNPQEGLWTPETRWTLTEELRIGDIAGELVYQFGAVTALDVDSDGSVFVMDQQAAEVRVFDAQGEYLRTLGGPGSGPGELGPAGSAVLITDAGEVLVPDLTNARLNRYLVDGTPEASIPLDIVAAGIPLRWKLTPDQRLLAQLRALPNPDVEFTEPVGDPIVTFSDDGAPTDTALVLPPGLSIQGGGAGGAPRVVLFSPEPVWDLGPDGTFVNAMNDSYRVRFQDADGRVTQILQRDVEKQPVTESDMRGMRDLLKRIVLAQGAPPAAAEQLVAGFEFAENYPAFLNLLVAPDGSVWLQQVQTVADLMAGGAESFDPQDLGSHRWDIFDGEGRYLGVLEFPVGFTPLKLVTGQVYGTWQDDLGVPYVMRLSIDKPIVE